MRLQNIIFISLVQINTLEERGIYQDLLRQFVLNGHSVVIVCPVERRTGLPTRIIRKEDYEILQVRTLNIQKAPVWEKGIATVILNRLFKSSIENHLSSTKFDLILYCTPPITLTGLIGWLKKRDGARTYLLLKDIFPQNAVDMGMLRNGSILCKYFEHKERELYNLSDRIGCMSPANVKYIVERFQELKHKVEENPNSIDLSRVVTLRMDPKAVLERWGIPTNSVIFLYGGNLGIAQGTTFLLSLLSESKVFENVYFLIVGDGADYSVLKDWFDKNQPTNAKLIRTLPKTAFDELAACCDVGLILLRKEFTIPNFPSRLLTYMENKMPVLAITDKVSDIGSIAENAGFGIWCCYGDKEAALSHISFLNNNPEIRSEMGKIGFDYMKGQYDVKHSYNKIIDPINKAN